MLKYCIFFLFLINICNAQEPAHFIVGKDALNGLDLYSIIQDSNDDSVWITTENGIYNYNGHRFEHQIPDEITGVSLFGLTKDSKNNIYCFNLNGQIFKIVNKKLILYYTIPNDLIGMSLQIAFTKNDDLLIYTNYKIYQVNNNFKEIKVFEKNRVEVFYNTKNKLFYQRNNPTKKGYQLVVFDKEKTSFSILKETTYNYKHLFTKNKVIDIYEYIKDIETTEKESYNFLKSGKHKAFVANNTVWFSSLKKGGYKVNVGIEKDKISTLLFKDYFISGIMIDNEKNTWLLTFNKGIIIIPNDKIVSYNNVFKDEEIKSISNYKKTIYLGSSEGYIYKIRNNKVNLYKKGFNSIRELSIFDNIEVVNGFFYKNSKLHEHFPYTRNVNKVSDSVFYLASIVGLLKTNTTTQSTKNLVKKRTYTSFYNQNTKKNWIATTIGLQQHSKDTIKELKFKNEPIMASSIISIDNNIWIASKKGIFIYKNDTIINHLTKNNGLLSNRIQKIIYKKPNVYISSRKAIQQYNLTTKNITSFTKSNGLYGGINDFEIMNDTIYTLTGNGLLRFSFKDLATKIKKYKTLITSAVSNGSKDIKYNEELLPSNNNVEFSFLTPTFTYKNNIEYEYRLKGHQKEFIKARKNQNYVQYANLPSGKYTFEVVSSINNLSNFSSDFPFSIKTIWYKSFWFIILLSLTFLGILFTIYKVRLNILLGKNDKQRMEKQLAESSLTSLKAQMNPHFMFNAMNSIQSLVLEGQRYDAYEYLTQLSSFVRKNLTMSDVTFISYEDELSFIKMYLRLEKLRFKDTFQYKIITEVKNEHIKIPSMIIQPFVENAIKHGLLHKKEERELIIKFTQKSQLLVCKITDNGIGREASKIINAKKNAGTVSFSTSAIHNRFEILKMYYKLAIGFEYQDLKENNKALGTKVTIKIPYNNYD